MDKPIVTHGPVVSLDIGVLLRLSRLNEINADAAFCSPGQGNGADVFRAVVASDGFRFAPPFDDPVERTYHAFGR